VLTLRNRLVRWIGVGLAAVCAGPAAAHASTATTSVPASGYDIRDDIAGPVLAGDRVVFAFGDESGTWTVDGWRAGTALQTIAVSPLPTERGYDGDVHVLRLYGEPDRLTWYDGVDAVDSGRYQEEHPTRAQVTTGPPGGPFVTQPLCVDGSSPSCGCNATPFMGGGAQTAVVGGTLLVGACTHPRWRAYDLRDPARPSTAVPADAPSAPVVGVRAENGVWAFSTANEIVVDDAATGATVARHALAGPIRGVGVDADGTVVTRVPRAADRYDDLQVQRPRDAAPVGLPLPGGLMEDWMPLAVAGHRVATFARFGGELRLVVLSIDGAGPPAVIARFPDAGPTDTGYSPFGVAMAGSRVMWLQRACGRVIVGSADDDAPGTAAVGPQCPYPDLLGTTLHFHGARHLVAVVRCPRGCRGTAELKDGRRTIARRPYRYAASSQPRRLRLLLSPRDRRRYARSRREFSLVFVGAAGPMRSVVHVAPATQPVRGSR
jgi:hypothetical protein